MHHIQWYRHPGKAFPGRARFQSKTVGEMLAMHCSAQGQDTPSSCDASQKQEGLWNCRDAVSRKVAAQTAPAPAFRIASFRAASSPSDCEGAMLEVGRSVILSYTL